MHTKRAIKAGLSENRRALVSVWQESSEYSLAEKAALFLAETVTKLPCPEDRDFARTYARGVLTDEQYSAVQWLAISMNATFENPLVAERDEDGRGTYEIFADSSGSPAGFTQFFTYTEGGVKQRIFPHTVVKEEFGGHGLAFRVPTRTRLSGCAF